MTVVPIQEVCLRQRDNSRSLERCFVAVDGICFREMLVGGTAEVQVHDPCILTLDAPSVKKFRDSNHLKTFGCVLDSINFVF